MITIFYNPVTGQIRQKNYSSQGLVPETPDGLEVKAINTMEFGSLDPARHYVDVTSGDLVSMPPKPSEFHRFDYEVTKRWVLDEELAWAEVRLQRNKRLTESDWITMTDAPLSDEKRAEWLSYRQALRDVPEQSNPLAVVWPVPPT